MSAAKNQNDVLEMFYREIPAHVNRRLPPPLNPQVVEIEDVFFPSRNDFNKWLRVWKIIVSEENPHNKDLFEFARANKERFTQLITRELKELKNIKVSLEMKVKFKKEQEEQTKYMEHYFRENVWGAIVDIITNFFNICSTSNLRAKLYIQYAYCHFFLPNSNYLCYVLHAIKYLKNIFVASYKKIRYGKLHVPYGKLHVPYGVIFTYRMV